MLTYFLELLGLEPAEFNLYFFSLSYFSFSLGFIDEIVSTAHSCVLRIN